VQGKGRPRRVAALIAAALTVVLAPGAGAVPGDLDPSFGGDGRVALPAAGAFVPRAVVIDAARRIVIAGYLCEQTAPKGDGICLNDGDANFRLARLTPDGGLDSEFGDNGFVTTQLGDGRSQAFDVTLDTHGRIIAAGVARIGKRDVLAIARYRPDGALDDSFGTHGAALAPVGAAYASLGDVEPGPSGTLLAAGQAVDAEGRPQMVVARFTNAGRLDDAFGDHGVTIGDAGGYGYALGLAIARDGAPLAAGVTGDSADPKTFRFGELAVDARGRPVAAFGDAGYAEQWLGKSASFANAVALTSRGFLAAGAATVAGGRQAMALVKGTRRGDVDPDYGRDGEVLLPLRDGAVANDLVVDRADRALLVGQEVRGSGYAFATARLLADGVIDAGFGRGGAAAVAWTDYPIARATAAAMQQADRLVSVGIGCDGGTTWRCVGGTPVLLVARQLAGDSRPAIRAPAEVSRADLREGVTVRVRLPRRARLVARLIGRRRGSGRRLELARLRARRKRERFALRLRARPRALARTRAGKLRLAVRAGSARASRTITLRP
jgi:uncharacterized delta-60 repeat protein